VVSFNLDHPVDALDHPVTHPVDDRSKLMKTCTINQSLKLLTN